jgi:hypothetical protein
MGRFDQPIEPMTPGNMRELGVRSHFVSCWNCHHQAVLSAERCRDDVAVPAFGPLAPAAASSAPTRQKSLNRFGASAVWTAVLVIERRSRHLYPRQRPEAGDINSECPGDFIGIHTTGRNDLAAAQLDPGSTIRLFGR